MDVKSKGKRLKIFSELCVSWFAIIAKPGKSRRALRDKRMAVKEATKAPSGRIAKSHVDKIQYVEIGGESTIMASLSHLKHLDPSWPLQSSGLGTKNGEVSGLLEVV